MFVSSDNIVSLGFHGAFENTIIRFICKNMEMGAGLYNGRNFSNRFQKTRNTILRPGKFLSKFLCSFSENGDRGVKRKAASEHLYVELFSLTSMNNKCRNEDVGVEDDFQI